MRRTLLLLLLATSTLVVSSPAPAASTSAAGSPASTAPPSWGVAINDLFDGRGRVRNSGDLHLATIKEQGLGVARADAFWVWAELGAPKGGKHRYTWGRLDGAATAIARHGLRWLPVIAYSSYWGSSVAGTDHAPPRDDADFAAYAAAFAKRYGRGGEFWRLHPELPRVEVTDYEIWNEPNLTAFWLPKPDAARYGSLYRAARTAIREVDPRARAIVGGLSPYGAPNAYLRALEAARPGFVAREVDAVGLHPYASSPGSALSLVRSLRRTLDDLGGRHVELSVTEVGWPATNASANADWALPEPTRAGAFSLLGDALAGSGCGVDHIVPYTWAAPERDPGEQEDWFGIYHPDGSPAPAGSAYTAAARRSPPVARVPVCEGAGTPLRLGLSTARDRLCVTASVTYRGHPVNGVSVDFGDGTDRATDDDGRARHCASRARRLRVVATVGESATSSTRALDVR